MSVNKKLLLELKEKAPDIPRETCSVIDNVRLLLEDLEAYFEREEAECFGSASDLMRSYLEHLRFCNSKLRDSGKYWYDVSCDLLKIKDSNYD